MLPTDRLTAEIAFHDRQAQKRAQRFHTDDHLRFRSADYLDHETWIRPAFARLGPVVGLDVLDLGCGHAMASVVLARQGARVTALDLSGGYLEEAARRARANEVAISFVQGDGERLPFPSAAFDRIWGNAVLHHLDRPIMAREVRRVLRPGGIAVFCEPWGDNLLLDWARRWLPYPGKERTRDETPLRGDDLSLLQDIFPTLEVEGHQLLGMTRRLLGPGLFSRFLACCDDWLFERLPALQRFCRYVVLTCQKERYNDAVIVS